MIIQEIIQKLKGQTIKEVLDHNSDGSDCGMTIITETGDKLEFGYIRYEGRTWFNGEIIKELE